MEENILLIFNFWVTEHKYLYVKTLQAQENQKYIHMTPDNIVNFCYFSFFHYKYKLPRRTLGKKSLWEKEKYLLFREELRIFSVLYEYEESVPHMWFGIYMYNILFYVPEAYIMLFTHRC